MNSALARQKSTHNIPKTVLVIDLRTLNQTKIYQVNAFSIRQDGSFTSWILPL
jgi:hypothetical protein